MAWRDSNHVLPHKAINSVTVVEIEIEREKERLKNRKEKKKRIFNALGENCKITDCVN